MTYRQAYKNHQILMIKTSVIKSLVLSSIIGLGAAAIVAFATMFTDFNGVWVGVGVLFGLTAILTPVLYFVKFRPDEKSVAEQLDRLGFDERAVTMLEYANDESTLARIQRDDAQAVISAAAEKNGGAPARMSGAQKREACGLSTRNIIIAAAVAVVAIVGLAITSLPPEQIKSIFVAPNVYSIDVSAGEYGYLVTESDGYIYNEAHASRYSMKVDEGKSSEKVVATAHDNIVTIETDRETGEEYELRHAYVFNGWDDGYYDEYNAASRYTDNVTSGYGASALYKELELEKDLGVNENSGNGDGNGNSSSKAPPDPNADSNGGGDGNGDQLPPPNSNPSGSGSESLIGNGSVIDGNTPYGEVLPDAKGEAMNNITGGGNGQSGELPPSLGNITGGYFGSL